MLGLERGGTWCKGGEGGGIVMVVRPEGNWKYTEGGKGWGGGQN